MGSSAKGGSLPVGFSSCLDVGLFEFLVGAHRLVVALFETFQRTVLLRLREEQYHHDGEGDEAQDDGAEGPHASCMHDHVQFPRGPSSEEHHDQDSQGERENTAPSH